MTQTSPQLETLEALARRLAAGHDTPRPLPRVSLADALARGDDPLHIIRYFAELDRKIANLEDLLAACTDPGEEEIEAYRVEGGVAVFLAVDGLWALFTR